MEKNELMKVEDDQEKQNASNSAKSIEPEVYEPEVSEPKVYLVGAGPGDPGLLTLRGKECLAQADVVIYDQLVSPRVLDFCHEKVEKIAVRDLPGCHPERWPYIFQRMIEEAQKGKRVVRLKGGDPLIFGRGGEEMEALRQAGISHEVIPGVTTALAAGAYLDIPLTHREMSSAIALITGHEHPAKPNSRLDWKAIAQFPGTIAIYMGMARLPAIVAELIACGKSHLTPVAVVSKVSTGEQRSVKSTLGEIENAIRSAGLVTPAMILMGEVVNLKPERSWFEKLGLLNHHILITRPKRQAEVLLRSLENLGALTFHWEPIRIEPIDDFEQMDKMIDQMTIGKWDWVVFTSANGVTGFLNRVFALGKDARIFGKMQIAAVGGATAETLLQFGLRADLIGTESMNSDELLRALLPLLQAGTKKNILIIRTQNGRELLQQQLGTIANVDSLIAYKQVENSGHSPTDQILFDHLRRGEIDMVVLTSKNIAQQFLEVCDETIRQRIRFGQIGLVTNSSRTSSFLKEQGFPVAIEANKPNNEGLIEAILALAKRKQREGHD